MSSIQKKYYSINLWLSHGTEKLFIALSRKIWHFKFYRIKLLQILQGKSIPYSSEKENYLEWLICMLMHACHAHEINVLSSVSATWKLQSNFKIVNTFNSKGDHSWRWEYFGNSCTRGLASSILKQNYINMK